MIARYTLPEMAQVWSDQNRYKLWLRIELEVSRELAFLGGIPKRDWVVLKRKLEALLEQGGVDSRRVDHYEQKVKHDVIAFTTAVAERVGPLSRYVHFGLTSSDVVDSALSMQIQEAGAIILQDLRDFGSTLRRLALRYQGLPTIGRSHGIFAEPTSFGLKFLGWYTEMARNEERLKAALRGSATGKLSGAVGVNPHYGTAFEQKVLKRLGLRREVVATQVIPRDRHAQIIYVLAMIAAGIERIAVELRHLQRSEVGEVIEGFGKGQKGSSAMPHKRNPISSENLTGVARVLRGYAASCMENIALWHERDISHSSVERVIFPDGFILVNYALRRMTKVLQEVQIREDRVKQNLEKAGKTVFSGHVLLALVEEGMTREDAYKRVQDCALRSLEHGEDFLELLIAESAIRKALGAARIRKLGSLDYQLRSVKTIFKKALKDPSV